MVSDLIDQDTRWQNVALINYVFSKEEKGFGIIPHMFVKSTYPLACELVERLIGGIHNQFDKLSWKLVWKMKVVAKIKHFI